jgi:hypothetical protein
MLKQKNLITFEKVEEAEETGYHQAPDSHRSICSLRPPIHLSVLCVLK